MTDLSFTLARVEDRAMITAVLHRYAHNAREGLFTDQREGIGMEDMLVLFEPDATIVLPTGVEVPAAGLAEVVQGNEATYIRHHITTIDIRFKGADEAETYSHFIANTNEAVPDHWGHWHDTFRKQPDGSWLIQKRAIVGEGGAPGGWAQSIAAPHGKG